jgi:hypothetical protein
MMDMFSFRSLLSHYTIVQLIPLNCRAFNENMNKGSVHHGIVRFSRLILAAMPHTMRLGPSGPELVVPRNTQPIMPASEHSFDGKFPSDPTIQDILDAGGDPATVLYQLTNDIHPIFQAKNRCVCKFKDIRCCVQPHFANLAANDPETPRAPVVASPDPEDNIIVRATLQLASLVLVHDDTLPFWAGIVDCLDDDGGIGYQFQAHEREHLPVEQKEWVLEHLDYFADRVRFHYKADEINRTLGIGIDPSDPDWNRNLVKPYFAYKDGKPTVETEMPLFANIVLDTSDMDGYDQRADSWKQFTVSALKREIFNGARVLCHEIAHALVNYSFGFEDDPAFNEEKMIETGFSLENFIFGGVMRRNDDDINLLSSPNKWIQREYKKTGTVIPTSDGSAKVPRAQTWILRPDAYECFLTDDFWKEPKVREGITSVLVSSVKLLE